MYFWRIQDLKRDLVERRVGQREAVAYLLWLGGLSALAAGIPLGEFNWWDHATTGFSVIAFVVGTKYAFSCNGGPGGDQFLTRYLALGWVFGIRFLVLAFVPVVVVVLIAEAWLLSEGIPEDSTVWEFLTSALMGVAFYFRLGHHCHQVSSSQPAA